MKQTLKIAAFVLLSAALLAACNTTGKSADDQSTDAIEKSEDCEGLVELLSQMRPIEDTLWMEGDECLSVVMDYGEAHGWLVHGDYYPEDGLTLFVFIPQDSLHLTLGTEE